jgi:Aspartyl protease
VPFHLRILVIGLALVAWVEAALPAQSFEGGSDRAPRINTPSMLDTPGGVVPTARAGDLLFAAISINGSSGGWWLVDTGATMCEFDLEIASRLHLKRSTRYRLVTRQKNRGEHFVFFETSDLLVGTIQCGPLVLLAHPLVPALRLSKSPANWPSAFDKTGLLGMNLLAAKRALILWRKQQVYLNPDDHQLKSKADYEAEGYTAVPLNITPSRQVQVDGTLGGNHYQFCLDTGTPKTTIEQSVVDQDGLKSRLTGSVVRSPMNEFPDSKISQVIGTQFRIGDFDLSSRKILAASLHLTKSDRGDIWAGLIGADILSDYDAVIDFGASMLYLRRQR